MTRKKEPEDGKKHILSKGRMVERATSELEDARKARVAVEARRAMQAQNRMSASDVEVILGPMPGIVDRARRDSCEHDLELFLTTYKPYTYFRPFSPAHKRFIKRLEQAMNESMWVVECMPRGFGKTTLTEGAAEWAILYGKKKYFRIVAANGTMGDSILAAIKHEIEENDLICEDFPEVVWPIRALEGKHQRATGQMFRGKLTGVSWASGKLIFPTTTEDNKSNGSVIDAVGWTAGIRGARHRLKDGSVIRPDFVMVDDPQDDEMAASPSTCRKFLDILQGAILGLGGHDKRISVVMPSTIIKTGDSIDQMMDAKEYPAWLAENIPMLINMPEDERLWLGEYSRIRSDYDRSDPKAQMQAHRDATAFYEAHRAEMDAGAVATWEECMQEDEVSAIQHAMNIKIDRGEDFFQAECQGNPTQRMGSGALITSTDYIAKKISGLNSRTTSPDQQLIVGFIDVGHEKLQWMLMAYRPDFTGSIIDYGLWPEGQKSLKDIEPRLLAAVHTGLTHLLENMTGLPIPCSEIDLQDQLKVSTILIDCGDPTTRESVFQVTRSQRSACRTMASRGRAHHQFYLPDPRKKRITQNAYIDIWKGCGPVIVHDACVWRERMQQSIMMPQGAINGIDIYGTGRMRHRELATHICSERLVEKLAGQSGEMFRWTRMPGTQNHFLDCAVGCMVACTMEGLRYGTQAEELLSGTGTAKAARRIRRESRIIESNHNESRSFTGGTVRRRRESRQIED